MLDPHNREIQNTVASAPDTVRAEMISKCEPLLFQKSCPEITSDATDTRPVFDPHNREIRNTVASAPGIVREGQKTM